MLKKVFKINSTIYDNQEALLQAVTDFAEFDVRINNFSVEIEGEDENNIVHIFNEFMNYVVFLHNELS